jgi:hypothetical protein
LCPASAARPYHGIPARRPPRSVLVARASLKMGRRLPGEGRPGSQERPAGDLRMAGLEAGHGVWGAVRTGPGWPQDVSRIAWNGSRWRWLGISAYRPVIALRRARRLCPASAARPYHGIPVRRPPRPVLVAGASPKWAADCPEKAGPVPRNALPAIQEWPGLRQGTGSGVR